MRLFNKIAVILVLAAIINYGCKKTPSSQVQNVLVDITIYTTDPGFAPLNSIGGWVYITGGVRGIIVYQQSLGVYMAYDRDCTYMPSLANAIVHVDSTNVEAVDSSCGSKFLLYNGEVLKGPAPFGLKQYNTAVSGSAIHIYSQ